MWRVLFVVLVSCQYTPPSGPDIDAPAGGGISIPDDAPPADQRCTARYGAIDSYQLCVSTETSCTFYAHTNGGDCMTVCTAAGGTCLQSRDGDCVDTNHTIQPCTELHSDQVCICGN